MPKKGITNNPNGRPKGIPNKSTETLRAFITTFIEKNTVNLQSEFDKMDGPEKFKVIERLLPYVLPKVEPETLSFYAELPTINIIAPKDY